MDEFNKTVTERLKGDNFKFKEGEAIIYDDIDDDVSNNDNLGHNEPNVQNMNDAVERNDYDNDEFDALLSVELLLPNKSPYKLKNDKYGEPKRYLGANIKKYQVLHNKKTYWSMHAYNYVVEPCKMV